MRIIRFLQNLYRGFDIEWAWNLSKYKSKKIKSAGIEPSQPWERK